MQQILQNTWVLSHSAERAGTTLYYLTLTLTKLTGASLYDTAARAYLLRILSRVIGFYSAAPRSGYPLVGSSAACRSPLAGRRAHSPMLALPQARAYSLLFLFSCSRPSSKCEKVAAYGSFYAVKSAAAHAIADVRKLTLRWGDVCDLLYNIFLAAAVPAIFSSHLFKNEALALNWSWGGYDVALWRYYFPFFVFKLNSYNQKTNSFLRRLATSGVSFYIVTDCYYHYKTLYYLRLGGCYSVGLVGAGSDPWSVSYPIIGFFESPLAQLLFFRLVTFFQKAASLSLFTIQRSRWCGSLSAYPFNKCAKYSAA